MRGLTLLSFLVIALVFHGEQAAQAATTQLIASEKKSARLVIGSSHIYLNSDSLYVGAGLLERGKDYHFVSGQGYFDLSNVSMNSGDTLRVSYSAVPAWLVSWYGRALPDLLPRKKSLPTTSYDIHSGPLLIDRQSISITGA